MNREYAYNRDKGKCRICNKPVQRNNRHCHHVDNSLNIDKINKVSNLAWMHKTCHGFIHSNKNFDNMLSNKVRNKMQLYKSKLAKMKI